MKELQIIDLTRDWIVTKGISFLTDLLVFLVILFIGSRMIKAIAHIAEAALKKAPRVRPMLASFVLNVLRKTLWVLLLMIALPRIGVEIGPSRDLELWDLSLGLRFRNHFQTLRPAS